MPCLCNEWCTLLLTCTLCHLCHSRWQAVSGFWCHWASPEYSPGGGSPDALSIKHLAFPAGSLGVQRSLVSGADFSSNFLVWCMPHACGWGGGWGVKKVEKGDPPFCQMLFSPDLAPEKHLGPKSMSLGEAEGEERFVQFMHL